jgi:hypothetical protein
VSTVQMPHVHPLAAGVKINAAKNALESMLERAEKRIEKGMSMTEAYHGVDKAWKHLHDLEVDDDVPKSKQTPRPHKHRPEKTGGRTRRRGRKSRSTRRR